MHKITNKLSFAWLLLSLLVSPLQAQLAPLVAVAELANCPMHAERSPAHADATDYQVTQAKAACAHCQHSHCDTAQCGTTVCSSLQMQWNVSLATALTAKQPLFIPFPTYSQLWASVPTPPLYRPPV